MGIVIVYFDGEVELWKNRIDLLLNGLLQSSSLILIEIYGQ